LAAATAAAREPETDLWLLLGAGRDTNPTRRTGDGPNGAFAEARYDAEVDHVFSSRWKWFFDGTGQARRHESSMSRADRQFHHARLGLGLAPLALRKQRALLQFGATYRVDRNEFLDRLTGEPYTLTVVDGAGTREYPIPDRYDADVSGFFADLYLQPWKRGRVSLATGFERASYRQDYPPESTLRPLDNRTVYVEPGVHYRVRPDLLLGLSVQLADIDYEDELGRDAFGDPVLGSLRELRYADARFTARWTPLDRLRLSASLRSGTREDPLAGYYDYTTRASSLQVEIIPRQDLQIRLSGYVRDREDADIPAPELELDQRLSDRRRIRASIHWSLRPSFGLFAEAAQQTENSWQPEYTHDEDWVLAGIAFHPGA
jgi:hypothetical protein